MSASSREKVTVTKLVGDKDAQVEGELIAPGLAITPMPDRVEERFSITHMPSGRSAIQDRCAKHIEDAAALLLLADVDWTVPVAELVAQQAVKDLIASTSKALGHCRRFCGTGPSWQVRCHTCDWEYEPELEDGPLDAKNAKWIADEHRCDPEVQIAAPDSTKWLATWQVNDDGTPRGAS